MPLLYQMIENFQIGSLCFRICAHRGTAKSSLIFASAGAVLLVLWFYSCVLVLLIDFVDRAIQHNTIHEFTSVNESKRTNKKNLRTSKSTSARGGIRLFVPPI